MARLGTRPYWAAALAGVAAGGGVLANAEPGLTLWFVVGVGVLTALGTVVAVVPPWRWRRRPVPPPTMLPVGGGTFRGHATELAALRRRYGQREPARQRVLLLHGPPGTGKSALAQEFARSVAADHPDGQLYANLSWPGHLRSPGEVLKSFLEALGREPSKIPAGTEERSKLFRSLVREKRVLVLLDSVQDPDELAQLLPAGPDCTVVVTSIRDLSRGRPAADRSVAVGAVSEADALAILRTRVGLDPFDQAVPAAEIVGLCGRLPLALRSAAELAKANDYDLHRVAELLRPERTRLDRLATADKRVKSRLEAEFERLTDREQRAFLLLGLVAADTFLPWVLVPLMGISLPEAGNLVSQLHAAQLLAVAGPDVPSGMARYVFHPLVRLYARERAARSLDRRELHDARDRLVSDYLGVIGHALRALDPTFTAARDGAPVRSRLAGFAERIRHDREDWVRAEYPNLIDGILAAHRRGEWGTAWRIAAYLDEHALPRTGSARCWQALERAHDAAVRDGNGTGRRAVRLAQAAYAVAREDYPRLAAVLPPPDGVPAPDDTDALLAHLRSHRYLITAYGQMGAHREARDAVESLLAGLVPRGADPDAPDEPAAAGGPADGPLRAEWLLLAVSRAEARGNTDPGSWARDDPYHGIQNDDGSDQLAYRVHTALAEAALRGGDWAAALGALRRIPNGDDSIRTAAVAYRSAWLDVMRADAGDPAAGWADAVADAAGAVAAYERTGNDSGAIRARCVLATALLRCDRAGEAAQQLDAARRAWRAVREDAGDAPLAVLNAGLLDARLKRVGGELLLRDDAPAATVALSHAVEVFRVHGDFWSLAEASRFLALAHRDLGDRRRAIRLLLGAAQTFTDCGDASHLRLVVRDLADTCRLGL